MHNQPKYLVTKYLTPVQELQIIAVEARFLSSKYKWKAKQRVHSQDQLSYEILLQELDLRQNFEGEQKQSR